MKDLYWAYVPDGTMLCGVLRAGTKLAFEQGSMRACKASFGNLFRISVVSLVVS